MTVEPGKTQIGFIGLGIMGAPMAKNLLAAGYQLKVYNRSDRPRVAEVIEAGGVRVTTPKDAAEGAAEDPRDSLSIHSTSPVKKTCCRRCCTGRQSRASRLPTARSPPPPYL